MHNATFLQDLAIVMIVAAVVTVLFRQLKQPVVLGYILAGVIIGPHTPPFPLIADEHTIETLSELGVIFLMFSLGLEFSLRKLTEVGATALIAASLEIVLMIWAGYEIGLLFGWGQMDSIFLGAILSISSTTIIIKALEELGKSREKFAQLIFGILIVEDILAIVMIALLSGFATTGSLSVADIGTTVIKLTSFLGVLLVAGLIAVPRLLNYVARFKSNETLLITVVGLCFGVALLAVKLGYSVALGAFLIGAIIAEARQIGKIEALTHPVRDLFSAVFFVSIGLLIDPALLVKYWVPILVISAVVILGKLVACAFGTFVAGNDLRSSVRVGMGLAQIGEFSFIIAAMGLSLKVTSDFVYPIAVAVSALTTLTTPYLVRSSDWLVNRLDRVAPVAVLNSLDSYTSWVGRLGESGGGNLGAKLLRRWGLQIGLNLILVTAVFITANFLRTRELTWLGHIPGSENNVKAILWLSAMLVSLPMLIAVFRKLQAAGMLISEMSVTTKDENTVPLRAIVSHTVLIAGGIALLLFIFLLSAAILPSWNVLLVLALVLIASVILLRRSLIQIHAKAQIALHETFAQPSTAHAAAEPVALPPALRDAELASVVITETSRATARMIGEMRLRTKTGASVVSIERSGGNIINPGPDEEVQTGDVLILLGSSEQLASARLFLSDTPAGRENA
ncbi:MAG: putative sodium/proton antiporter [Chthoniobacteraceae bacterium]|nr:putative sodium/proton antiporter [Chthoniobacteraceae bacterium]